MDDAPATQTAQTTYAPVAPEVDLQALAEAILRLLKRDLRLEKERGARMEDPE